MEKGRRSPLLGAVEVVGLGAGVVEDAGVGLEEKVGSPASEEEGAVFSVSATAAEEVEASASSVVGADASVCVLGFLCLVRFLPVDELVIAGVDIAYVFWVHQCSKRRS